MKPRLYWRMAAVLMMLAGLVEGALGKKDWVMGGLWIALGALFLVIGEASARREKAKDAANPDAPEKA